MIRVVMTALFLATTAIPAHAQTEADLWAAAQTEWGQSVSADDVTVMHVDFTCDGNEDYIAYRVNKDDPDGPLFDMLFVTSEVTSEDGSPYHELISMPFTGATEHFGVCGEPGTNEIDIQEWDIPMTREDIHPQACNLSISIKGGMCDYPQLFWHVKEEGENSQFVFFRP